MKAALVPVTRAHLEAVAAGMRQIDVDECWAALHLAPLEALLRCVAASARIEAIEVEGVTAGIAGVQPIAARVGCPWLLATPQIERRPRDVLVLAGAWLAGVMRDYPRLVNFVDDRHVTGRRWLEKLGFDVGEPQPYGPDGLPFRRFEMEYGPCAA